MTAVSHFLVAAEPYIFQVLLGLVALFGLLKDWKDYAEASKQFWKPLRIVVLAATLCVILLSIFDTYVTHKEAYEKEQIAIRKEAESKKRIDDLTEQVTQEREENKNNADGFRTSFARLYDKYSELIARSQNADLIKEIKRTRDELKATQDKLNQPKARLTASFWHPGLAPDRLVREVALSRQADGSITLDLAVVNTEDVTATSGGYTVRLCEECRFLKEPSGSTHVVGSDEQDRQWEFERILAHSAAERLTMSITAPATSSRFEVDLLYSCINCVPNGKTTMWVNIR